MFSNVRVFRDFFYSFFLRMTLLGRLYSEQVRCENPDDVDV